MTQILVDTINPLTPEDEIATLTSDDHQDKQTIYIPSNKQVCINSANGLILH